MKKAILLLCVLTAATAMAQSSRNEIKQSFHDEIKANPRLAGSNYTAYPDPTGKLTPTPLGYTPYYISHYGRHGSRWLINPKEYSRPVDKLAHADSLGLLTADGKYALEAARRMKAEAYKRWGELTPLGARQHRDIARRMIERFPEVFADSARIDARSTVVIRCILSMENELQELLRVNPKLKITCDASEHDMYYMNRQDKDVDRMRREPAVRRTFDEWVSRHTDDRQLLHRLFNSPTYADTISDGNRIANDLFSLATIAQDSGIGDSIDLYHLFTTDELYRHWQQTNAWWYLDYGASAVSHGLLPTSQTYLACDIVEKADENLKKCERGATMRFGHESVVLPLVCLLDINGYGTSTACIDSLEAYGWINTRIYPMACNVQFIFYKPDKADEDEGGWLVKVLLNEEEASLPINPAGNVRFEGKRKPATNPYYKWSDVRSYILAKCAIRSSR